MFELMHERADLDVRELAEETTVKPIKIMHIIGRMCVGGPAILLSEVAVQMNTGNYRTQVVSGMGLPSEGVVNELLETSGVRCVVIPEMGREISLKNDFVALAKLIKLMRRENPDVVHTHTAKAGTLGRIAAFIALRGRKTRILHTFHGHVFHGYFNAPKTRLFILIEKALGKYSDVLIAVTEKTRRELIEYGVAPPEKLVTVTNGMDLTEYARCDHYVGQLRDELCISDKTLVVGMVARLVPIKRVDLLLDAAAQLTKKVEDICFVVAGDGEMRGSLEQQARDLGIADKVKFLGFRRDVSRILAGFDIAALTSDNEGLPTSIIEAMAAGRVVVSTNVGGVVDMIEEGKTGFMAPPNDTEALVSAFERALRARKQWPEISARARELALRRYNLERFMNDLIHVYRD